MEAKILNLPEDISTQIAVHHGVIKARWILILGLGFVGVLLKVAGRNESTINPTYGQIALLVGVASVINIIYLLYLRFESRHTDKALKRLAFFQVTIDTIIFTTVLYLAGGIDSTAFLYYVYPIIAASQLFKTRGIIYSIVLSTTLFALVIGLEFFQIVPHIAAYAKEFEPNHYLNRALTFAVFINVIMSLALAGGFASVTSQIKEKHAASLKSERDRVSDIIESLHDGIILIDNHHRIILINKSAERLVNLKRSELVGMAINRESLEKRSGYENILKIFFPANSYKSPSLNEQYEVVLNYPAPAILDIATIPVMAAGGAVIGFLKNLHDVTREKEIDRMKSEFISIAAHQLRTPLSAIKWSLKMVLDGDLGNLNRETNEFITKTYNTNERMIRLVNSLLNVSRIEEGRFKYSFEQISIVELVDSTVQEFLPTTSAQNITLLWKKPGSAFPKITADADRLRLAIQNILDNALKYSQPKGSIKVALTREGSYVNIAVEDSGVGIPKDEQHRIFSKFYRGSNVIKMQTEGSGLGLFIVKNIIDKHDGDITFSSKIGEGTTFTIKLPLTHPKITKQKPVETFERFLTDF